MAARQLIAALVLSASAFVGLLGYEGYSEHAYIPVPGDVATIGFGTTQGVKIGDRIVPLEAVRRALVDVAGTEQQLKKCIKVPVSQNEYDAFIQLSYNIGINAFCSSTLVKKLNAGDYQGACAEISRWDKFKGKPLKGLTNRRAKERALCESTQ